MTIQVLMPALSPTMTEGNLAKWHKQEGDAVASGDIIAEIETDKATMEIEADEEGVLGRILVAEGSEGVAVNTAIAVMLEEGEDPSALDAVVIEAPAPASAPAPTAEPAAAPAVPAAAPAPRGTRAIASPLARRMASQAGLNVAAIAGSGPRGRVVKSDVEAALAGGAPTVAASLAPAAAGPAPVAETPGMPSYTEAPNSGMRKVIARRLIESKREAPHFYLTVDCHIDALLDARKELNSRSPADGPDAYKISVNDFVIRAAALALGKVPAANASWTDAAIRLYHRADISVAVAVPEGLITPVIRDAGAKGLAVISSEMKDLAGRARDGKLAPEEYQGGTFSISNLGMFGIKEFSAVINPPPGAILAVGMGEQRPVVRDGALAVATVMSCTLSIDHRVVDGAAGAQFMAAFKALIEDPLTMLL
ncbi:MAG: pyruvate dehydrogenase complex dihydrolipoamide acetyltransferase [Pseudomonadota bacterium]|nr:pyruvate dehydrogenase complex dihydrolipoamide acetyltransferase [Pseudomonadota bacterium]